MYSRPNYAPSVSVFMKSTGSLSACYHDSTEANDMHTFPRGDESVY